MRKQVGYTIIFVVFLVGVFLVIEGIFRIGGIGYTTEPFERVPGTPYYRDNPDFLNKYYPGRRTPRSEAKFKNLFLVEKPTNGFRVFIVGGSTAQGWPFEPNQSFGKMIEVVLQKVFPEKYVEVINLGYSAMSSYYVADVVKKLFRYQPDVLLLYTGQNEYYGTLSVTTGRGYRAKKLYLALREWRIFQLLFSLFETKKDPSRTMMAAQFAGRRIAFGEKDTEVAEAFSRNLRGVFDEAEKHHVPVVVYEMAANLIHMPPFASQDEELFAPLLLSNQNRFRRETWKTPETARLLSEWQHRFPSNAHVWYLTGIAQRAKQEPFLESLRRAKDLDMIPFRYREGVREVLWRESQRKGVIFLPLQQEIEKRFGYEGFGRLVFIDHLHFQYLGQVFLAELGTKALLSLVNPTNEHPRERLFGEVERLFQEVYQQMSHVSRKGLAHDTWLDASIFFTAYDEFMAIQNILVLLSQSPYREMLIPFGKDPAWERMTMVSSEPWRTFVASYDSKIHQGFGNFLLSELAKAKRWEDIELLLEAYRHNNPGSYVGYRNCAEFFLSQGQHEKALKLYAMAYLLAEGRERDMLGQQAKRLAEKTGDKNQWEKLLRWLAKNPWSSYNICR
ncbi:MAG: hypothetical protein N2314_01380 [Brevinematales bacterium]|nr:hypothetical protein [Brevinematales bacterium]